MSSQKSGLCVPPWNFSWIVKNKLAGMSCPYTPENIHYIMSQGINHLITLSPDTKPSNSCPSLKRTVIPIEEFEAPSISQIQQFIGICHQAILQNEVIGIHCRMGLGRTGVMAACYLVYFHQLSPDRAITNIRLLRPGSIETFDQEIVVKSYNDMLRSGVLE